MIDPPLRGAIIGYGFIAAEGHVPAYAAVRDEIEIVAVADPCPARRSRARDALPRARVYDDHASLLLAEAGRLDFIDIATPPSEHARIARAALARGLHVLCEKPLATTPEDVRLMIGDAQRANRVLFPGHNYKHAPVIRAVRSALDAGSIGQVRLLTLQTFRTTHARGAPEWRPDWRREKRWAGGGIGTDHGSHTFYLAFDWFGAYPTAISARTFSLGALDTEDNMSCTMTFPTGIATAELSWTAGVRKVIYTIHGDLGAIRVEDDDVELSALPSPAAGSVRPKATRHLQVASNWGDPSHVAWFESLFARFVRAVRGVEDATRELEDALKCTEVIAAAYGSAADGGRERALPAGTSAGAAERVTSRWT
jgi:predicted dehydrogenase